LLGGYIYCSKEEYRYYFKYYYFHFTKLPKLNLRGLAELEGEENIPRV
jgi:hypothetical protein